LDLKSNGFTFIEITVVIVLIGLTLLFAVPRFRSTILTDDLKKTARRMVRDIKEAKNDAVREHRVHNLHLDLDSNRFWTESTDMTGEQQREAEERAYELPEGTSILDVWRPSTDKVTGGETVIRFTKQGYVEQSAIHLGADDGRQFTLVLSPFLARVNVLEKYVEFSENL
jgi:prepilin-type N-terminal cleavage/methylation domain-containing protein